MFKGRVIAAGSVGTDIHGTLLVAEQAHALRRDT
jgi:hypothetical protein